MHIIVGSKNPVKIKATRHAFLQVFKDDILLVEGIAAPSDVQDQPMTYEETLRGATNRAHYVMKHHQPDFAVGIEGGLQESEYGLGSGAWIVIQKKDGRIGRGKTGTFFLPPGVAELVRNGKELGEADDKYWGKTNSKQKNGAVGILTKDTVTREAYYIQAILFALIPFNHPEHYE